MVFGSVRFDLYGNKKREPVVQAPEDEIAWGLVFYFDTSTR